ncbi:MAG: DUF418 domain-containing protein [Sphingomonas sp.]|nr:DUF418 domain-containing protein [Sphingomonas sp.]
MATSAATSERLITLDLVRGIAVMGIFSVNVVGMAMIQSAYFTPSLYGFDGLGDKLTYAANFLLIDGKMRSLFSIIFGASTLLVIDRAGAAGRSPATTHFARMAALLLFGLAHFYLLWWGDILAQYALIGMVAFMFRKLRTRALLTWGVALLLLHSVPSAVFSTTELRAQETQRSGEVSKPQSLSPQLLAEDAAAHETIAAHTLHSLSEYPSRPFTLALALLVETLGLMLLGMAAYRSRFLAGEWDDRSYRQVAIWGIGSGLLVAAVSLYLVVQSGFAPAYFNAARNGWTVPLRAPMALGYAALTIMLFRRPSALRDRFAAVGRAAFTNYLGCTLIGVAVFFGFAGDLYGDVSRGQAWLLVPPVWALMLLWSKPWLDRFNYGPFEWAWRSLARGQLQPMRRSS